MLGQTGPWYWNSAGSGGFTIQKAWAAWHPFPGDYISSKWEAIYCSLVISCIHGQFDQCILVNTPHFWCINPQGQGTVHILLVQSREAPVETALMTFAALQGASAFQLFFTAAGADCQVQKVPAPNCIGIILYNTIALACQVTCTVERVVFARGNATFLWW